MNPTLPTTLSPAIAWTPARERLLLLTLAAIQFTVVLDFLIILPLGPQYMQVFGITARQFGWILSSYAIAAGISGLVAGFFLDLFDRKRALLILFFGFTLGTFLCAIAPSYYLLLASRFIAGTFGGIVGAVILAIVGDVIPAERRGRAMGMVMSAFSVASIFGVPLGIYLAARFNWHVPFYGLSVACVIIFIATWCLTPSLRGHMENVAAQNPVTRTLEVMLHPDHLKAFLFMALLTYAGFGVFAYLSSFAVANVGLSQKQLGLIYLCGGVCTLFSMNWIGRWADRIGKHRVFMYTSLAATVPVLIFTNLPKVPLAVALSTTTLLMICMSGRMVPAMAMMTGSVEARYRGGFMSLNSSVQQLSVGIATISTGFIIGQNEQGQITHFPLCGYISIACVLFCIYLARFLKAPVKGAAVTEPILVEAI